MERRLGWRGSLEAAKQADTAYQAWRMKAKERARLKEQEEAEVRRLAKLGAGRVLKWAIRQLEAAVCEGDAERVRRVAEIFGTSGRKAGKDAGRKVAAWTAEALLQIRGAE